MTTESKQDTRPRCLPCSSVRLWPEPVPSSCWRSLARLVDGAPGVTGALVGGGLTLAVFVLGSACVNVAARACCRRPRSWSRCSPTRSSCWSWRWPWSSSDRAGLAGDELSRGWFAGRRHRGHRPVAAGQVVAATRQRIPAFEEPVGAAVTRR